MEPFFKEPPDNFNLIYDLALTNRGVGNKNAALALEQAIAVIPVEKDAFDGPAPIEILARVAAHMRERDRTIAALQKILLVPYEGPLGGGQCPLLLSMSLASQRLHSRRGHRTACHSCRFPIGHLFRICRQFRRLSTQISRFMSLTARNGPTTLSRMNKLCILPTFVISLLLLALTPGLRAQTAQGIENAEKVAQELKLTPQQEAKVLPILKQEAPKIEEIKNNASLSGIQKMRQLRAIHSETAPELQKILSPEQYQKLQAIREERIKEAMAKKRAGG